MARAKYGKLLIDILYDGDNDKYYLSDESLDILIKYGESKQFKDIIIRSDNEYINITYQLIGSGTLSLSGGMISVDENGHVSTSISLNIFVNTIDRSQTITYISY